MTPSMLLELGIVPALAMLPDEMGSPAAEAMILAIALQESHAEHRHQIGGPAHSYWQFEKGGGVRGVLAHPGSKGHAMLVCATLDYEADAEVVYVAMEHNDVLAAAFARLLLWTLPNALPDADDPNKGWTCYVNAWRPGKPHRETWDAYFEQAWQLVAAE